MPLRFVVAVDGSSRSQVAAEYAAVIMKRVLVERKDRGPSRFTPVFGHLLLSLPSYKVMDFVGLALLICVPLFFLRDS